MEKLQVTIQSNPTRDKTDQRPIERQQKHQSEIIPVDLQAPPSKKDLVDMMSHLERTIKGEMGATRRYIQCVLQRVEGIEDHLEEHKSAITELRERAEMDWTECPI